MALSEHALLSELSFLHGWGTFPEISALIMQIYSDVNKWRSQTISNLQRKSARIVCPETGPTVLLLWQSGHVSVRWSHTLLSVHCPHAQKCTRRAEWVPPSCHCNAICSHAFVSQSATRLSHRLLFALAVCPLNANNPSLPALHTPQPVATRAERPRKISLQTTRSAEANLWDPFVLITTLRGKRFSQCNLC